MLQYGPERAKDYSPGCQPGVLMEYGINSEGVAEQIMASTLTNLLVHVVFSTKGREPIIKSKTFKEELIEILDKHGVDYNLEYLWG